MKRFVLGVVLLFAATAGFAQARFVEGVNYVKLNLPQPVSTKPGKVEVIEFFSYACIHCFNLQPFMDQWVAKKPANAELVLKHVAFNPTFEMWARAFYAAQALGIAQKSHDAAFNAIFKEHQTLTNMDSIAQMYSKFGVDANKFLNTATSANVTAQIDAVTKSLPLYAVDGTPTIVVGGKYQFDVVKAGGDQAVPDLINFLVTQIDIENRTAAAAAVKKPTAKLPPKKKKH
jgi:protein dithiol oxidoreductase (disulfide-forming)